MFLSLCLFRQNPLRSCFAQAAMPFPIIGHRGHDVSYIVPSGGLDKRRRIGSRPLWTSEWELVKFWVEPYQEFQNKGNDEDRAGVSWKPCETSPSRLLSVGAPFFKAPGRGCLPSDFETPIRRRSSSDVAILKVLASGGEAFL